MAEKEEELMLSKQDEEKKISQIISEDIKD
jgi:hypothetical protein